MNVVFDFEQGEIVYFVDEKRHKVIDSKIIGFSIIGNIKYGLLKGWTQSVPIDELFRSKVKAENKLVEIFKKDNPDMNKKDISICAYGVLLEYNPCMCFRCTTKCTEGCGTCSSMNGKYKSGDKWLCINKCEKFR